MAIYNNGFPMNYQYMQQPQQIQYQQGGYQQIPFQQQIPQNMGQPQQIPQQNNPMMQMQQSQQTPVAPSAIRSDWVQGQAGANAYNLLKPGEKAFLFDSDNSCFYVKIIDADGRPLPLKIFDYQERGTTIAQPATMPQVVPQPEPQPQIDLSPYVTRDEITQLVNQEVERRMSELTPAPAPVTKTSKKEK